MLLLRHRFTSLAVILIAAVTLCAQETVRVSVASDGLQADGPSAACRLSGNGGYVSFESSATNLVPGDDNGQQDIFLHDLAGGETLLISHDPYGNPANGPSRASTLSLDGRWVAYSSKATNLLVEEAVVLEPTFAASLGATPWLPSAPLAAHDARAGGPVTETGRWQVYVLDRHMRKSMLVSVGLDGLPADADAGDPWISGDGRFVAFSSVASNFVANDTNGLADVFLRDLWLGVTTRVSVSTAGHQANGASDSPRLSLDGRYVAFRTNAGNFAAADDNAAPDVYVRDRQMHTTTLVSVDSAGAPGNLGSQHPSISLDGRYVAFDSRSSNLGSDPLNGCDQVYRHDRLLGLTEVVSVNDEGLPGNGYSHVPMISPDGRYVAFRSEATNLVRDENGSADAFVRDVVAGTTLRVSVGPQGVAADGEMPMDTPGVGFGAGVVTFCNAATNLVAGDTNDAIDIFAHFRAVEVAFEPFGVGLAGSGDLVPHLFGTDGDGVSYALDVWGGLGGAHGMLMVGLGQTELPAMGGTLYVDPAAPWLPLMFVLSGSVAFDGPGAPAGATVAPMLATQQASFGSAPVDTGGLVVIDPPQGLPGEGAVTLWFSLTGAEGMTLHLQAVIHDPGAPEGVALTNALHMSVNDSVND